MSLLKSIEIETRSKTIDVKENLINQFSFVEEATEPTAATEEEEHERNIDLHVTESNKQ